MSACKRCGAEIRWARDVGGKWRRENADGSDHWDKCKREQNRRALAEGTPFKDDQGDGVIYQGKKRYMHMVARSRE